MVSGGCQGSSITQHYLRVFLEELGHVLCKAPSEPFHVIFPDSTHDVMNLQQFQYYESQCLSSNATAFIYKLSHMKNDTVNTYLAERNAMRFRLIRRNALDHKICSIRDCFDRSPKHGFPCDSKGNPNHVCMKRRRDPNATSLACVNPEGFISVVANMHNEQKRVIATDPTTVLSENLLAFQYNFDGALDISMQEWHRLLSSIGEKVTLRRVQQLLWELDWTPRSYTPQRKEIYNYDAFEKALMGHGKEELIAMLRRY